MYELTTAGWELADALVVPLAVWGARHKLDPARAPGQRFQPEWSLTAFARLIATSEPEGSGVYGFTVDGQSAFITHAGVSTAVTSGPTLDDADASVATSSATVADLVAGRLDTTDAMTAGNLAISGTDAALRTLFTAILIVRPSRA